MTIRRLLIAGILFACLMGVQGYQTAAEAAANLDECSKMDSAADRLRCYDEMSGRAAKVPDVSPAPQPIAETKDEEPSYLSRSWLLDEKSRKAHKPFAIMAYNQNYILPYTYNSHQEKETYEAANPGVDVQNEEVKYQISLKVMLWDDIFGTKTDLWFGYTQKSLWQLYNTDASSPFRETNYEPEILFNYRIDKDIFGVMRSRFIQVGFNHQSNGRSEPLSRSWNRIVANFGFEREPFSLVLKTWVRVPESSEDDDNRDISAHMGYGEIWLKTIWKNFHMGLMYRNNLRFSNNRSNLMLELSFPMTQYINGYVQYYTGYGESLVDYNHYTNRIGFGVMIKDW